MRVKRVGRTRRLISTTTSCRRVMEAFLLAVAAFLATADASNTAGQHPTAHALIYILSSPSTAGTVPSFYSNNGSLAGAGQVLLPEFGAFTEDNLEENGLLESSAPPGLPPKTSAQTVIDMIAVFGAMFVAGVAIILITVYISKLRKRQSSSMSADVEMASTTSAGASVTELTADPAAPPSIAQLNKEVQEAWSAIDFGHKPSLWRKTIRSVILRLRGQEQHKDVYVMPQHLRHQLKQMYVY